MWASAPGWLWACLCLRKCKARMNQKRYFPRRQGNVVGIAHDARESRHNQHNSGCWCSKPVKPAWMGSLDTWATAKFIFCEGAGPVWPRAGKSRARQIGREGGSRLQREAGAVSLRALPPAPRHHARCCTGRAKPSPWLPALGFLAPLNSATTVVYTQIQSASIRQERKSCETAALGVIVPAASRAGHRHRPRVSCCLVPFFGT